MAYDLDLICENYAKIAALLGRIWRHVKRFPDHYGHLQHIISAHSHLILKH